MTTRYAELAALHGWADGLPVGSKVTATEWVRVLQVQPGWRPQTATVARVLATVADDNGQVHCGAGEVARLAGVRFDTARNVLRDLRRWGWVQYDPTRQYVALTVPPAGADAARRAMAARRRGVAA